MKTKPLVTVYVLVYNNESELQRTIDALLLQDYDNVEVIISDDGSTKYDTSVLEKYVAQLKTKYSEVRLNINPENVGTVKHLNRVFRQAKGDIYVTCSSGDMLNGSSSISTVVNHFIKTNDLIATARRIDRYEDHEKVRPSKSLGFSLGFCPKKLANYMIREKNLISGCCTYYRKELFEKYGYHDEDYHLVEDYPYYVMLLLEGEHIGFINKPTIVHTIGGVSTGKVHPSIYKDIELMREKMYQSSYKLDARTRAFLQECHNNSIKP